jgi:hypothetical protein
LLTGDPSHQQKKDRLRMKGWKKINQANGPRKQAGVAILISDKVHFKPTLIKQDKEGHSLLIKGKIDQREITIYPEGPKSIYNSSSVVVGDFNTLLLSIDRSSKQKINNEILDLKYT